MTIYIDIVIIENLIMNYIILLATGVVTKSSIKSIRLIFASLLGAVYSVLAYSGILKVYSNIVMKILLSVIIIYVAFNPQNKKKMWKTLVIFYLISFAFGGADVQAELLREDGVEVVDGKVDLTKYQMADLMEE